jgi:hypothetical protein
VATTSTGYLDRAIEGRQSQTRVRLPEGRRVVEAHASELPLES